VGVHGWGTGKENLGRKGTKGDKRPGDDEIRQRQRRRERKKKINVQEGANLTDNAL